MRITAQSARRWWAMLAAMIVLTLGACSATTESAPQMEPAGDSMPAGDLAAAAPENLREEDGTDAAPGEYLTLWEPVVRAVQRRGWCG